MSKQTAAHYTNGPAYPFNTVLEILPAPIVAGTSAKVTIHAYDQYGNPAVGVKASDFSLTPVHSAAPNAPAAAVQCGYGRCRCSTA